MHVHEYQAKSILKEYGIPCPDYWVVSSLEEAQHIITNYNLQSAVLKAQVHAGGRGKSGGIHFAHQKKDILQKVKSLLGLSFKSHQTADQRLPVHQVMITPKVSIEKEFYVGALLDREKESYLLILSKDGGVEIEELAKTNPEKILKLPLSIKGEFDIERAKEFMGFDRIGENILLSFAKAFVEKDALLFEINPLVLTKEGDLVALDAKFTADDNALFRQKEVASFYDPTQLTSSEVAAKKFDLAYVPFGGNIGCIVNGAGLAMATVDMIYYFGGKPANFLDVGGSASKEKIAEALKIIINEGKIRAILINIFGGIMSCTTIAEGVLALKNIFLKYNIPLIVRMEGTNVEKGRALLLDAKIPVQFADNLEDAAKKVILAAEF